MTLKCTVDGGQEGPGHPIFACHHCGKPVCEQHGWVVSADDAFDDSAEDPGRRVPQAIPPSAKRVPQPAMHCKQCVDENHPRASKHAGWMDPREVHRAAVQARAAQAAQAGGQPVPQPGQPWGQPTWPPGPPGPQQGPQQGPAWGQPGQQQGQQWGRATGRP